MPMYLFRCRLCDAERYVPVSISRRDEHVEYCNDTTVHPENARMVRVPTPANFRISGYNAKNGYSK